MFNWLISNSGNAAGKWSLLRRIIWLKATVLSASGAAWETLSGAIVSFIAPKAHALKEVVVGINPVQSGSGDPSPDNVRPISGWTGANVQRTGVNVWDEEISEGLLNSDGTVAPSNSRLVSSFIPVVPGKTYAFVWPSSSGRGRGAFYDADKNLVQYNSDFPPTIIETNVSLFTVPNGAHYLRFNLTTTYGTTYNNDVSINYPDTDHDYHAYVGNTYAIDWTDEAGTVYGGTLTVNEDGSGSVEVSKKITTINALSWDYYVGAFYANIAGKANNNASINVICSVYAQGSRSATGAGDAASILQDKQITGFYDPNSQNSWVYVKDSSYATAIAFKTAMGEQTILFDLATPVTYQLTTQQVIAALQGYNNVWANTGDVTVTFRGEPIVEPDEQPLQALNLLLGGAYRNNQTQDDVSDEEALDILLGGADR